MVRSSVVRNHLCVFRPPLEHLGIRGHHARAFWQETTHMNGVVVAISAMALEGRASVNTDIRGSFGCIAHLIDPFQYYQYLTP